MKASFWAADVGHIGRRAASLLTHVIETDPARKTYLLYGCGIVGLVWFMSAIQWPLHDLVVPWDSKNQFYAFFRFMAETIHNGSSPFWNPYHYSGHPSVADPQSMVFAPAFLIWAVLDPKPSLFAFDAVVSAHLLTGGLALVFYGRRHGWPLMASVLAAAIFMLGGVVAGRMSHVGIITAFGLFPVALLWMEIAVDRKSHVAAAAFGFAFALIVLARTQVPLLMCAVLVVLALHRIWTKSNRWRDLIDYASVLAVAALVTLAIVIVPFLLTIQFAEFSNRPQIDKELALRSSLYPLNLATFFSADVFGSLRPLSAGNWGPSYFTRPEVDATARDFNYLFMGTLTALLFVWHGLMGGKIFAAGRRIMLAITAFGLLYAFGRYSPLFPFLFDHVPGVSLFRRPVGGAFIFVIGIAFLSGALAAEYARGGNPKIRSWIALPIVLAVAALLAWAIAFSSRLSQGWEAGAVLLKSLPIYIGLWLLLILPKTVRARQQALAVAVGFTCAELCLTNAAMPLNAEARSYYSMLEEPTPEVRSVLDALKSDMKRNAKPDVRPRVEFVGLTGPWQNAAMVLGIEATTGYNPLRIGSYDRLVSPGEGPYTVASRRFPSSFSGYDCLLGQQLGLEYVVMDMPIEKMPSLHRRPVADIVMNGPKVWIYRLHNVAPRITFDERIKVADAAASIDAGIFPSQMIPSEVLVDIDDALSQSYLSDPKALAYSAKVTLWKPDRIEIDLRAPQPGILTLHDLWYPGWQVEVDGQPRRVLRADILFRGVEVPAGEHKIVFAYRPLSLTNLWSAAKLLDPRRSIRRSRDRPAPLIGSLSSTLR